MKTKIAALVIIAAAWSAGAQATLADWKQTELTDVNTGESFRIADFAGTSVLLESFAVWCPVCTAQQREIRELHEAVGHEVVSISLNTDPNEDIRRVRDHTSRHGFSWRYAVAPDTMIQALIDEFGFGIVNAPSAPMVLICEDQTHRPLRRGVKRADRLRSEIAAGCE